MRLVSQSFLLCYGGCYIFSFFSFFGPKAFASVWNPDIPNPDRTGYTNASSADVNATAVTSSYIGVVECPCTSEVDDAGGGGSPLLGYLLWDDLVRDMNNFTATAAAASNDDVRTFIVCPNSFHDAVDAPALVLQSSHVILQCGAAGALDGCVVTGAKIKTADSLQGISIRGMEFREQRDEFKIGVGTHVTLQNCRFMGTLFPGLGTVRAPVVSFGTLDAIDCSFRGNFGLGAVLVAQGKARLERTQFIENKASEEQTGASAIQVGDPVVGTAANVSIVDSCFENNMGKNIVLLLDGSLLSRNRGNAVLNVFGGADCRGVTVLRTGGESHCDSFQFHNTSCDSFFESAAAVNTSSAPVVALDTTTAPSPVLLVLTLSPLPDILTLSPVEPPAIAPAVAPPVSVPAAPSANGTSSAGDENNNNNDDAIVPLADNADAEGGGSSSGARRSPWAVLWLVILVPTATSCLLLSSYLGDML